MKAGSLDFFSAGLYELSMSGQKKAVFLDRDGTIIEDSGYIGSIDEVIMFTEAFDALKRLQNHYELFVVTNQ
ncbi:MAG: D,D-heptose 1,7-bisphosphate phosphatase, partial [Actinomycetales bacterium]